MVPIGENQHAKILWDVPIPTDKNIVARRPDIFLQDKRTRRLYLIEMAVAWDSLQIERRAEKLSKYGELCADLRGQFPGYRLDIVPVVIGDLGTVTHNLVGDLGCLPYCGKDCVTDHRNATLCVVFHGTNPEKSLVSVRAGSLNPCGICCWSPTCEDRFPPSLSDEE